ncbi:MAG: peptide chain release factor 1 [Elusimicrobia bacterium]|nr:peptide chain release factor 1 [Elusimicrobiota bacterium]
MEWQRHLKQLESRYLELEQLLASPEVLAQSDRYREVVREHTALRELIVPWHEYQRIERDLHNLEDLLKGSDQGFKELAAAERDELLNRRSELETALRQGLIPKDPREEKPLIIEIRAGTGGDEAALFAGELFRMYLRFCERQGWATEVLSQHPTGLGGFKEAVVSVKGKGGWSALRHEAGVHRVQRVPVTEAGGRIHTSTATVAVLPEADEVEVHIDPADLKIDTFRSSGAGGQHVNKTESAVRITHLPTGIVVTCQDERSQLKNRAKALKYLRAKLHQQALARQQEELTEGRRRQVGGGERSEKIRTYNFPQDRMTDHRLGRSFHNLKAILDGEIGPLIEALNTPPPSLGACPSMAFMANRRLLRRAKEGE